LDSRVLRGVRVVCVERLLWWVARFLCFCIFCVCCCCCVVCYGLRGRGHASRGMTIHIERAERARYLVKRRAERAAARRVAGGALRRFRRAVVCAFCVF